MATATLNSPRTAIFQDRSTEELLAVQRVYIEDYNAIKEELETASELYKSGQVDSAPVRAEIDRLVRQKLGVLEDINVMGAILDSRDGTITV